MVNTTRNPLGYLVLNPDQLKNFMGEVPECGRDISESQLLDLITSLSNEKLPTGDKQTVNNSEFTKEVFSPKLQGKDIGDHFEYMADEMLSPWKPMIVKLLKAEVPIKLDQMFSKDFTPSEEGLLSMGDILPMYIKGGWTRITYDSNGKLDISYPKEILEDNAIYDCETFVKGSPEAHPVIATAINSEAIYVWVHPQLLDQSEPGDYTPQFVSVGKGKLLVAHNSAYDYPRVSESFHMSPLSPETSNAWLDTLSMHKVCAGIDSTQGWAFSDKFKDSPKPKFAYYGSPASLLHVYNFHCKGNLTEDDKEIRKIFVRATSIQEFRDELKDLLKYALSDVYYTLEVFKKVFPKYIGMSKSKTLLVAQMYLATSALPVRKDWFSWVEKTNKLVADYEKKIHSILLRAIERVGQIPYETRLLDSYFKHLPEVLVVPKSVRTEAPLYLFKLMYKNNPVAKVLGSGLCYEDENLGEIVHNDKKYSKIPHPEGDGNVGSLFSEHFAKLGEKGIITSAVSQEDYLELCKYQNLIIYWNGSRDRIMGKAVEPRNHHATGIEYNVMPLNVVPHNTITLRTGEVLWLTAAGHNGAKCGSELRGMVMAPEGDAIVSMDWASQELQILSAYSASYAGISGSTMFDYSNLVGDKSVKTDIHSLVATQTGASRDATKASIYAIMYGAGKKRVSENFLSAHPELDASVINDLSEALLINFKGKKDWNTKKFSGGMASQTFNKMLEMLGDTPDKTPYTHQFGTRMAPSFSPLGSNEFATPSQINWLCQSAGTAMLHGMVVATAWLIKRLKLDARFCFSFHDEVVFRAKRKDAKILAYCMQIAHCWGWCLLHKNLGIYDMPVNRAWCPEINVDFTWRKDKKEQYVTPSNPDGYLKGTAYDFNALYHKKHKGVTVHEYIVKRWAQLNPSG